MASESGLVPEELADEIVRLCRTSMGDSLRSVTYFTRDDYDQLYLRSDLARDADLSTFVGYEWRDFKTARDAYTSSELGAYEYTIHGFESGFLVRVIAGGRGAFVTTGPLSVARFEDVVTAVRDVLE